MASKQRLTRFASFHDRHDYLDESCFADGEITENDYLKGGEEMVKDEKSKAKKIADEAFVTAVLVAGSVAAAMVACSTVYYVTKGTAELFKVICRIGPKVIKH